MATYHIKKGYTIPINGSPAKTRKSLGTPKTLGICPTDFKGIKPKLTVKLDENVKVGTPLFFDKKHPEVQFVSPAGGTVSAINYGPRRKILEIVITLASQEESVEYPKLSMDALKGKTAEELKETMLQAGIWPFLRRRPFNTIADPNETPKSVFVNCMDTAPLAADPEFSLEGREDAFAMGIEVLKKLAGDRIHVVTEEGKGKPFSKATGVHTHQFSGKHPAGLASTHISKIDPINKGEMVWVINARDLIAIGSFFETGKFPTTKVIALSGAGIKEPAYYEVRAGLQLNDLVGNQLSDGVQRVISGNILTGIQRKADGFLGFYDNLVSVIPEPAITRFMGWLMPGFSRPSFTRTFFSKLIPGKKYDFDTNLNGGHRAMVQSGMYEDVVALDVMPEFLIKAVLCSDIELMEKLGILECDSEDFALCSYICPSKVEITTIIEEGLELMEKDG